MKWIWVSRRTYIATLAIGGLLILGMLKGIDVSMSIATIAVAMAGANAYESKGADKNAG